MRVRLANAIVAILILSVVALVNARAQSEDPLLGTWTLDTEKSTFDPGPAPVNMVARYEKTPDGFKRTGTNVNAQGQSRRTEVTFNYDGKEYPVLGGASGETWTFKRIDQRSGEIVIRVNGKLTTTTKWAISRDGNTSTVRQTGTNSRGQQVNNALVLIKQR